MIDEDVEKILRSYPRLKAQAVIESEKLFNLFPSCTANYSGEPSRGNGTSDSTQKYAIKRADQTQTIKQVRAIELAFNALNKDSRELVTLYYFERWRRHEVMYKMHISRDQFNRFRRQAINDVAEILSKTCQKPDNFAL